MMQNELNKQISDAYVAFSGLRTKKMQKDEKYFPITNDILEMIFQARQNYIRYFSFSSSYPLNKAITNENIMELHSSKKKFSKAFPNSNYLDYLKKKISEAYKRPEKFAGAIQNYFIKKAEIQENHASFPNNRYIYVKKENIPIFANVIIPSIYGYFIEESQASYGFDFICFLFQFEYDFYKPFFLSYLMSATTFLDIFWDNFFIEVTAERFSPSLYQLKEMFFSSLKSSIPFFSTYHIQLLKNCLLRNYGEFFDLLFVQFIFPSFSTYNRLSLIPQTNMDLLLEYITESKEFCTEIQQFFHQYNFVDSQKVQFLKDEIFVILSHYELKLLFDLFQDFDTACKVQEPELVYEQNNEVNQFSPFYFSVRIKNNLLTDPFKRGPVPHVFSNYISNSDDGNKITEPKMDNDTRIAYALLKVECEENRINPLSVILNTEENSPDDTFMVKQLKQKYANYQNLHSLETNSIYLMKNDIEQQQKEFFSFLLQLKRIESTDDIKYRIKKRFNILEEQFYSNFNSQQQNQPVTFRSISFIPGVIEPFFKYRRSFVETIQTSLNLLKYNEFLLKNKHSFQKIASNISYLDSVEISERLIIMERNLICIGSICGDTYDANSIFLKCFSTGALRTLYETFIFYFLYKKNKADDFKVITSRQIQKAAAFFQSVLNLLKSYDGKNQEDIKSLINNLS